MQNEILKTLQTIEKICKNNNCVLGGCPLQKYCTHIGDNTLEELREATDVIYNYESEEE